MKSVEYFNQRKGGAQRVTIQNMIFHSVSPFSQFSPFSSFCKFLQHFDAKLRATLKWSFYVSFCPPSAHPSAHSKHCIGLTSLYLPQVGRRTRAMSGKVFYGRTVRWLEGSRTAKGIVRRRRALSDGGRMEVFTSF